MKKSLILLLILMFASTSAFAAVNEKAKTPFGYNLWEDMNRPAEKKQSQSEKQNPAKVNTPKQTTRNTASTRTRVNVDTSKPPEWEEEIIYYPNANLQNAVQKYKDGNFSGSLQELISLTKIDEGNPLVYYYMGMAYTQVGNLTSAVQAYDKVIALSSDKTLVQYAVKGRDCLTNGPTCAAEETTADSELDTFIKAPYGNGFSDSLNKQIRDKELKDLQKTINAKENLEERDIERIQKYDNHESKAEETIKIAQASDEDILNAIKTLKEAGVNVSVNPTPSMMPNQYNDISMMLGTSNNNNNSMMNMMIPYMMSQNENGKNIDPQVMQAMMMNSMLPDFTFSDNDKRY